jgi:hypothetical protein
LPNNKKIGVITFHRAINYGAVLQAYALYESLNKLGFKAVMIDYKNPHIERLYDPNPFYSNNMKRFLSAILTYSRRAKKNKIFEEFRTNNIILDKSLDLYSTESIKQLDSYDSFITGSDQVWNYIPSKFDKAYFLDFVSDSRKKNSYAASFGFERIPDEYLDDYKGLLADFNHISVREEQGVEIIKNLLNREAEIVIDPTMLLSKDDWVKISQDYKGKKNYILLYHIASSQSLFDFAINLSKQTNCEIIYISDAIRKRINATYASAISPQMFLGLFKNAKYIVTNSFHGTAFSINFNKLFFVEMLPPPAENNSRLINILDTFDLRSRQIVDGDNGNIFNEINYAMVNEKLELERRCSLDYLKRVLEE